MARAKKMKDMQLAKLGQFKRAVLQREGLFLKSPKIKAIPKFEVRRTTTATTQTISAARTAAKNRLKTELARSTRIESRRQKSLKDAAGVLRDPKRAEIHAISILAELSNDPQRKRENDRTNKHLRGHTPNIQPVVFIDSFGQGHMVPLLYTKMKSETRHKGIVYSRDIVRVVDPLTGAKFDGKNLTEAMKKYEETGIAADGTILYKLGGSYHTKNINVSNTTAGKVDKLMTFLGTTSMVALIAPEATVSKIYGAIAGGASMSWFAYRGGKRIYQHIEKGTFDLRDPNIRLDLAMTTTAVFTRGKVSTGIRIGGTALFISGLGQGAYDEITNVIKDKSLSHNEKRLRILETSAAFGGTLAFQVALRGIQRKAVSGMVKGKASVKPELTRSERQLIRYDALTKGHTKKTGLQLFSTAKAFQFDAKLTAAQMSKDPRKATILDYDRVRTMWRLSARRWNMDIVNAKRELGRAEASGNTALSTRLKRNIKSAEISVKKAEKSLERAIIRYLDVAEAPIEAKLRSNEDIKKFFSSDAGLRKLSQTFPTDAHRFMAQGQSKIKDVKKIAVAKVAYNKKMIAGRRYMMEVIMDPSKPLTGIEKRILEVYTNPKNKNMTELIGDITQYLVKNKVPYKDVERIMNSFDEKIIVAWNGVNSKVSQAAVMKQMGKMSPAEFDKFELRAAGVRHELGTAVTPMKALTTVVLDNFKAQIPEPVLR